MSTVLKHNSEHYKDNELRYNLRLTYYALSIYQDKEENKKSEVNCEAVESTQKKNSQ